MLWLLNQLTNNPVTRAIGAGLAFLTGLYVYGVFKVKQGETQAKEELLHEDVENALRIRKQAEKDIADAKASVASLDANGVNERLRKHGKLRD